MRTRSARIRPSRHIHLTSPERLEDRRLLSTFTVVNTDDSGPGSLRQAITDADAAGDGGIVAFDIPGAGVHTIAPTSDLPPISAAIAIDGTTQHGAAAGTNPVGQADNAILLIQLSGANVPDSKALSITGDGAAVRGLIINGCTGSIGSGIALDVAADRVTIAGNFIGTDPTGKARSVRNDIGIKIETGTSGLTIGGTAPADRNVLAGNLFDIYSDNLSTGVSDLAILGNAIEVGADGTTSLEMSGGSAPDSIRLNAPGSGVTIGGTVAGARNVINGAVQLYNQSQLVIQGNVFDTDGSGTARNANVPGSVGIYGCQGVTIGGPAPGAGNVFACPLTIGAQFLTITTGVIVQGNSIGTDATGTIPLGIGLDLNTNPVYAGALSLSDTPGARVGGMNPGEGNTIAFVQGAAMFIDTRGFPQGDLVLGNSVYANTGRGLFFPDASASAPISDDVLPQLISATTTEVRGTFQTGANRTVRVEFFATLVEQAGSPYAVNQDRQGKTFLGAVDATADADGVVDFSFTPPSIVGEQYITCTVSSTATGSFSSLGYSPGLLISGSAPGADMGVVVSDAPDPVAPGALLTYTITVNNPGADGASGVVLEDDIPAGTTFVSFTALSGWTTSTPDAGGTGRVSAAAADVIRAGASAVFTLIVRVDAAAANGSSISDTASVSIDTNDSDPDNDDDTATTTVQAFSTAPSADVLVTQSASPGNPKVGTDNVTFTVMVTNNGPSPASHVALAEELPIGAEFVSATGGISPTDGVLTFLPGGLASGASANYTIVVRPRSAGTLRATATVSSAETDPSMANNTATATAAAVAPPGDGGGSVTTPTATPTSTPIPSPDATIDGPRIVSVRRYGIHRMPTTIVLKFDQSLDAVSAQDVRNYRISGPDGARIGIRSAVYRAATRSVTLHPRTQISIHHPYKLAIRGSGSAGLRNEASEMLDGRGSGQPGSDFVNTLTWRDLILPAWYRPTSTSTAKYR